jgi:hypothetical protein
VTIACQLEAGGMTPEAEERRCYRSRLIARLRMGVTSTGF